MVLEHADGTVVGIEVKSAETVRGEDFRGLRHLASRLGDRFRTGIVRYAGEQGVDLRQSHHRFAGVRADGRTAPERNPGVVN